MFLNKIELQTFGCTQGVYKASSGKVDIGVSTQNGLSSNTPKGGYNTVIAKSPIILIVHQSNPVTHTNVMVASNKGAIGQQIYGYESEDVKILTIDGVLPDENTFPTLYGFYQDYNIITHGEPTGAIKNYINFAYTDEGKAIIKSMHHIPVN